MKNHLNDSVPFKADDPSYGSYDGADLVHHLNVDGELGVEDLFREKNITKNVGIECKVLLHYYS